LNEEADKYPSIQVRIGGMRIMGSEMFNLSKPQEERAAELHVKATVVDALSLSYTLEKKYLKRLKQGGVKVAMISINGTNARTAINVSRINAHSSRSGRDNS
jgi:hypothetical protein